MASRACCAGLAVCLVAGENVGEHVIAAPSADGRGNARGAVFGPLQSRHSRVRPCVSSHWHASVSSHTARWVTEQRAVRFASSSLCIAVTNCGICASTHGTVAPSPQSTRRSLPQTSSAFFLPLVSGTYHKMNAKKKADSAAKMK
jgi:hypothetical protein